MISNPKTIKIKKPNHLIDFSDNQNFYTDFYNIGLNKSNKFKKFWIENQVQENAFYTDEYWTKLVLIFKDILTEETSNQFIDFLRHYRLFKNNNDYSWEVQFALLNEYWNLINTLKQKENIKIFNKYIIFLNKTFYVTQKGFK